MTTIIHVSMATLLMPKVETDLSPAAYASWWRRAMG
jgi:hypothetical protein